MGFDFDTVIDRRQTNAAAIDGYRNYLFGDDAADVVLPCADDEAISMWVADMAFATAPVVVDAMRERLEHPIFGYSANLSDELFDAYAGWCDRRYRWTPDRRTFRTSAGVVPALFDLAGNFLDADDKVLTVTPAYGHFKNAPDHHGRELVSVGLIETGEGYALDLDAIEAAVADPALKMFFLCHPHNPAGRVWTDDELRAMTDLCLEHDVLVVSDEIHCDLLRSGLVHTPLAKLYPESDRIITCMSASKTFNLAGLGLAVILLPNRAQREVWDERVPGLINPVSHAGVTAAFRDGDEWMFALRRYVDDNFELVRSMLADALPETRFRIPDATYLAWIDLRPYLPEGLDLTRYFAEKAGVILEGGSMFIADGEGHVRVNVACPRAVLQEALERIIAAVSPD